jgi:N-acetylglucosamine malate deacetylase 1
MKKVIVVTVHPDDETLGCGGTLLKHKHNGDLICWLIITSAMEKYGFSSEAIQKREEEIRLVAEKYAFDNVSSLNFPTGKLDEVSFSTLISSISDVFRAFEPQIVYLPFKGDIHTDHRIVFDAAFSCTKTFRYPSIERVLMMETISETDFAAPLQENAFLPNVFVNITDFFEEKIEIMSVYHSEIKQHPFPRSVKAVEALATLRGAQSGYNYAEGFMLLKEIIT